MKSYTNPQPHAVDRINKNTNKSMPIEKGKPKGKNKTSKEIYKNEAEEQAWKETLKKDNPQKNFQDE